MPLLLDPEQALPLDQLLAQVDTKGLDYDIRPLSLAEMPRLAGLASLSAAGSAELSFLANPKYQSQLVTTQAGAVLLTNEIEQAISASGQNLPFARVVCPHPYLLYARVAQWFDAVRRAVPSAGVHPSAVVAHDAVVAEGVQIGPHCVVESGVKIGRGSVIGAGCVIGRNARIGTDGVLHARVTLYEGVTLGDRVIVHSGAVLGADGFGFAPDPFKGKGAWGKIPQFGGVRIGDDVEIGANTTIDRGALEDTEIGNGVKLDNQIMVAHNVKIGEHTAIAACVGIAGSTRIGARCTIGGAAMLSGHLSLADDVHISGGTAVTSSITQPGRYTGVYPYAEHGQWQRNAAVIQQLSQLRRRLRDLERA